MPKFGVSTGEFPHQEPCRRLQQRMGDSGGDLSRRDSLRALFSLNVVVVIWGSQHAMQHVVQHVVPVRPPSPPATSMFVASAPDPC